ncbi:MAG TPA: DUF389 domain-containing protein [Candidatus Sulfomarinibacteraceae bacterium]|nr:DUF389 domain-containing protein [Candidatus Sulfomarinibacteraceae bacterium]
MRQLMIQAPQGKGARVLDIAALYNPSNISRLEARRDEQGWELIILYVSNDQVGPLIEDLGVLDDLHITLQPTGVLPMSPPASRVPEQIRDVSPRSPMEVWLNGLQSIGSWKGFMGYALAAAIVVWVALFTNTIFLLVAAMLIAPFAGPAMNAALATAAGDKTLLGRSLLRYFVSLAFLILATAALSVILQQKTPTTTMVSISQLSSVAVLLPLIAGAAGALNLVQAENSSLVSGTAVGLLIAASLAPPAGVIGMAAALGRWDMAFNGAFTLLLQLLGINLAGSLVFRAYGVSPSGSRYQRGTSLVFYLSLAITTVCLALLLAYQFSSSPALQRSTRAQRAVEVVQQVIEENDAARLVETNMRFTRPSHLSQETLLGVIYVQRSEDTALSDEEISASLVEAIQQRLLAEGFDVAPVLDITVFEPPPTPEP